MSISEEVPAANDPFSRTILALRSVQLTIKSKQYFGFDLDDTLHEFRKASAFASSAVFEAIRRDTGIEMDSLKTAYTEILRSKTASAFTEGKTSTEYRRDRFSLLLQAHGFETFDTILERLLDIYKNSLQAVLELKPGALSLLQTLKRLNKKIIVITEGPQDAQEWTVRELGIAPYIDILVTTNEIGKSKVDGLFSVVLEKYSIDAGDIIYVGDNEVRDVVPARSEGLLAVFYNEHGETRLDEGDGLSVKTLGELEDTLNI
ncbi:HAD family hydrolase [Aspergillus ruber CBS 135680]|uniref:HAD-like protein n=1 Tax=Aspergillus ruber (strain CBS 135680) TaxID=1388766 RepID=A0A017SPW1_ASPRC|nr:HAD-like protein [Aspergillus ruber CBS 135680]EYE98310.1 HAD-like protein [Aspergillus ruber CBS 135680]